MLHFIFCAHFCRFTALIKVCTTFNFTGLAYKNRSQVTCATLIQKNRFCSSLITHKHFLQTQTVNCPSAWVNNTGCFSRWKILNNKTEDSMSTNHLRSVLSNRASSLVSGVWSQSIHTLTLSEEHLMVMQWLSQTHNLTEKPADIYSHRANALINPAPTRYNNALLHQSEKKCVKISLTGSDFCLYHFII